MDSMGYRFSFNFFLFSENHWISNSGLGMEKHSCTICQRDNLSIICAPAPTDESVNEAYDIKVVLDDLKAQVVKKQHFLETIEKHSLHYVTNDKGMRVYIEFVASRVTSSSTSKSITKQGVQQTELPESKWTMLHAK